MRFHAMRVLCLSIGAALCFAAPLAAGDKQAKEFKVEGQLTRDDPKDKVQTGSYHKVHAYKMVAGKTYRIDLMSKDFDTFLRLEDADGKQLADDDDGGEGLNSRIIHKAEKDGDYRVIATSFPPDKTGQYTLTIVEASPIDALEMRAKNILKSPPAEQKQILAELQKHLADQKDKLTVRHAQMVFNLASALEFGAKDLAADTYASFGKIFAAAEDAQVKEIGKMFAGAGRRLSLPGNQIELKGTTLEGQALDWKAYRGKVVLVDFWATWCGPCVQEMPNIRKAYETYHGKGFDVIAISLDRDKIAAARFMEKEKLPWKCLYDEKHPLAEYYGIFSIPQAILVDREGRVVSMNARGPELERLLEKYLLEKK